MANFFKTMSLIPKGLRCKTMIAFSLMSLIPLLVCAWIVITYIFPNISLFFGLSIGNISFILLVCIFISLLGLYITRQMIDPIIKIAGDAKVIAEGDIARVIETKAEDEVGDLSRALNIMTQKIKENIEELKAYSEKTRLMNIEINKKVFVLSGLLQIGNLISSSSDLQTILDFTIQKISDVENGSALFLMITDDKEHEFKVVSHSNLDNAYISSLKILKESMPDEIVFSDRNKVSMSSTLNNLSRTLNLKNIIIMPVAILGKICGAIIVGNNREGFVFNGDERELLKVFVKQVVIALENDFLVKRAKELAVKDELTGLYNQNYIQIRLDEEIKRSILYQRPCGYLLLDVDNFKDFSSAYGEEKARALLKNITGILNASISEVDKAARLMDDKFGVVLPEKNKRQVAHCAEDIRKKIEDGLGKITKVDKKLTVSIGVSENPIDGSTADELMEKAERLVRTAKSLGKNRVEV